MMAPLIQLSAAVISAVALSEVATVLLRNGRDADAILTAVRAQVDVVDFTAADALRTAQLYPRVSNNGLSLGDCACLALAERLDAPAVTAEHLWVDLDLDIAVVSIRPQQ